MSNIEKQKTNLRSQQKLKKRDEHDLSTTKNNGIALSSNDI